MKNLKKLLALVLALMMVLSMMVTASAATFPDDADIDHKEAVDVMAAAGILEGDGKGYFNPDKALERSAAAKLIAYLMLGETVEYVDQSPTGFADVPAAHWASGFIAYVAEMGIVVGTGGNNFNPNGAVNGYSFAKMVMLALCNGDINMIKNLDPTAKYNEKEGEWTVAPFTGNYTMKVNMGIAALKNDYGVDLKAELSDINMNADLTREHASQMVFNALNDYGLLETVYGLTKDTDYKDENGLEGYIWYYTAPNGTTLAITDPVITDVYVDSFSSGTTYAEVMKALGVTEKSTLKGINYMNSVKGLDVVPADWVDSEAAISPATNLDVYMNAKGDTLKFMYTEETLAIPTVEANPVASGANKGLYKWTFAGATTYAAKNAYDTNGAYLVVIANKNNVKSLVGEPKLAGTETGVVMGKGADYVTINNVQYYFKDTRLLKSINLGDERVLYLATDGTVLDCTKIAEGPSIKPVEEIVYVLGFYSVKVPATPGKPAVLDKYGQVIEEAVQGEAEHYDRYIQYVTLYGDIETALYQDKTPETTWTAANRLYAITFDSKTGIATLKNPSSGAVSASGIKSNAAKFVVSNDNYYYNTAEFVQVAGTLGKAEVTIGTLKGAAGASTTAWAIYSGEKTAGVDNLTVTKVFYWVEPAEGDTPVVDPDVYTDMLLLKDSTTQETGLIATKDKDGKDQFTPVFYHNVYLGGTPLRIKTYSDTITAGAKSYQVDEYGVFVEIKDLQNVVTGLVSNLYSTLISVDGGVVDYDITGVPVKDLSSNGNGAVDLGDVVLYIYTPDKVSTTDVNEFAINMIYIITSAAN